jgi:hypothetical protein
MLWLYVVILLAVAFGLWAAYRLLGTPSRLAQADYAVVLADVASSAERAARRLRDAFEREGKGSLVEEAADARKIFQTGYYQTLRLRPASGPDAMAAARMQLGRACQAYEWASRLIGSESLDNPLIREAAGRLLQAADAELRRVVPALPAGQPATRESTAPSP